MAIVTSFLIGFFTSFVGSLTPSMLNMTALKISLERNKKEAFWFSIGVSVVVLLQAYIAVFLMKYILDNPKVIVFIEKIAVVIFIVLSIYFYTKSKEHKTNKTKVSTKEKNSFLIGGFLSLLNVFAIPFYCTIAITFEMLHWLQFHQNTTLLFVIGSSLGIFGILNVYVKYSKKIQQKTGKLTKDINLILSFLTGIVAVFTLLKFFI